MSSHVFVLDSTLKRTQVKVTPGKSLREVLEEVCKSKRLNPEEYTLKTQSNKTLDLSQPFRLSGLSGGAKLQLTQASKSTGVVSVALQLPESEGSGRLSDKFPSTTSLWLILRKFEDAVAGSPSRKLNLTQRGAPSTDTGAGRLLYEQPCLHLLGRNFETLSDLQKTLGQLGLNAGSALLRLNFKMSEQPLEEAMLEISRYFGATDTTGTDGAATTQAAEGSHAVAAGSGSTVPDSAEIQNGSVAGEEPGKEPNEDIEIQDAPVAEPVENDVIASSEDQSSQPPPHAEPESTSSSGPMSGISVYRAPSSNTPAAAREPDDPTVFEPTIDHAKAHQAALNRAGKNTRLLSDKELAEQESQRQQNLSAIRNVTVRVRYPDQSQIETTVTAADSAAELYSRVAQTLAAGTDHLFELRYVASNTSKLGAQHQHQTLPRSPSARLVRDCGFRGKVMLTFVWGDGVDAKVKQAPSLKAELASQATDLKVELPSTRPEMQQQGASSSSAAGQAAGDENKSAGGTGGGKKMDAEAKMKRFLGFGKK